MPRRRRAALTPEARENQLVAMAYDLAETRIREGTATAQEIVHFLKLGSTKERLEREKLERENSLLQVKTDSISATRRDDSFYEKVLDAFRSYSGASPVDDDDDEYED